MVLEYRYSVHGYSGGMMLTRTVDGKITLDSAAIGSRLDFPNGEIAVTLLGICADSVTLNVRYRSSERILTVTRYSEEQFCDEANAYGFSLAFKLCDRSDTATV